MQLVVGRFKAFVGSHYPQNQCCRLVTDAANGVPRFASQQEDASLVSQRPTRWTRQPRPSRRTLCQPFDWPEASATTSWGMELARNGHVLFLYWFFIDFFFIFLPPLMGFLVFFSFLFFHLLTGRGKQRRFEDFSTTCSRCSRCSRCSKWAAFFLVLTRRIAGNIRSRVSPSFVLFFFAQLRYLLVLQLLSRWTCPSFDRKGNDSRDSRRDSQDSRDSRVSLFCCCFFFAPKKCRCGVCFFNIERKTIGISGIPGIPDGILGTRAIHRWFRSRMTRRLIFFAKKWPSNSRKTTRPKEVEIPKILHGILGIPGIHWRPHESSEGH